MDYYMKKTSVSIEGGYLCYQKNFIEPFSIPEFTDDEVSFIDGCNEYALETFLIKKYDLKL